MKALFESLVYFIVFLVLLFGSVYGLNKYSCKNKGNIYGIAVDHNISGCFVKIDETRVPINIYEESIMKATNVRLMNE